MLGVGVVLLRKGADTLGRIAYVPDFDVSGGNGEDETRGVPGNETTKTSKNRQNHLSKVHLST